MAALLPRPWTAWRQRSPAPAPLRWGDNYRLLTLRSSCGPCPRLGDDADADVDTKREGDPT